MKETELKLRCANCASPIDLGEDLLTVQKGVSGPRGVVPLGDPQNFCSEGCLKDFFDTTIISNGLEFSEQERSFAALALAGLEQDLLYALADLMRDGEGRICLAELELIEPSLFLLQAPGSLQRFADAICRKAQTGC